MFIVIAGAVAYWQLQPARSEAGAGRQLLAGIRTAKAGSGTVTPTLRLAGTTAAEKYVNITGPRMKGSRSRRGASLAGASIGLRTNITVSSTSSVAPTATMSALSQTGLVASSNSAAARGGGASGGPASGSAAMRAATTRIGGSSRGSTGTITIASRSSSGAMGSSGLGSTASAIPGGGGRGGGGGMRRRGDFETILQKLVPPGTMVKKGQVIAEFDRQYMLTRLDDYRASVAQHEANYKKSVAEVEVERNAHEQSVAAAKGEYEKAKLDMNAIPVLSAIQAERTRLALEEAQAEYQQRLAEVKYQRISEEADLQNARLDLEQARLELARAETNVEKLLVKAPIDGMTVMLNTFRNGQFGQVEEGDVLYSGQPFMQVVDLSSMIVNAKINQVDVEKIRIGMKARVRFDAFPDLELPATVYSVGTVAKSRVYRPDYLKEVPVVLKLDKTDPRVIPDLSVSADIILGDGEQG
ncbi:MAG: HlyD family efflux transporter periplasmic adaptor subunit, partial [Anaerolineae bacterium]|nr:HlyD family efflux transporter periplasmic adaptor subunit [Anaerolineae bacterium]